MTKFGKGWFGTAALLVLLGSGVARADVSGTPGKIIGFEHNDDSSDDFIVQTGAIFIDEGGGTVRIYRWDGQACAGRHLDIDQQGMLLEAMRGKLPVLPYYELGGAQVRCLVSFQFALKPSVIDDIAK